MLYIYIHNHMYNQTDVYCLYLYGVYSGPSDHIVSTCLAKGGHETKLIRAVPGPRPVDHLNLKWGQRETIQSQYCWSIFICIYTYYIIEYIYILYVYMCYIYIMIYIYVISYIYIILYVCYIICVLYYMCVIF